MTRWSSVEGTGGCGAWRGSAPFVGLDPVGSRGRSAPSWAPAPRRSEGTVRGWFRGWPAAVTVVTGVWTLFELHDADRLV